MRICLLDHHGKAELIGNALRNQGFEFSVDPWRFDYEALLVDTDHPLAAPAPEKHRVVQAAVARGVPIILWPHGAMPDLDYDGLRVARTPVSALLVHGEGHAEIFRRIGSSRRVEVIGWSYCETRPSAPPPSGRVSHLLFAPIHPWADGRTILPFHKQANMIAYQQFLEHPVERKTVRMFGEDAPNGVFRRVEGVEYTQSDLGLGLDVIDSADGVVSYGTFAYTALARGKPVAMIYPYPGHTSDDGSVECAKFEEYRDFCTYPATVGDAPLDELFARDVSEWKGLFVGGPLDEEKLGWAVRSVRPSREVRRKLVRARR